MRYMMLLLFLVGCASNKAAVTDESAPMAKQETDVWQYVSNKYDADKDGVVAREEYGRDVASFDRMDRNADGTLTPDEFSADVVSMKRMHVFATRMTVMRYFQTGDPMSVTWVEVEQVFSMVDANADGVLSEEEFAAHKNRMDEMRPPPPGMTAPSAEFLFVAVLDVVDEDGNRAIALVEIEGFFKEMDDDGDGVWKMPRCRRRQARPATWAHRCEAKAPSRRTSRCDPPDGGRRHGDSSGVVQGRPARSRSIFGSYT